MCRVDEQIRRQQLGRRLVCNKGQDNMAVRTEWLGETEGRPHLGGREVIERKADENDLMLYP